jgi:hypothetical protein
MTATSTRADSSAIPPTDEGEPDMTTTTTATTSATAATSTPDTRPGDAPATTDIAPSAGTEPRETGHVEPVAPGSAGA